MRIGFIGGNGHHYLRQLLRDPGLPLERPVGVAGDGRDDARARQFADVLSTTAPVLWFDDARKMLDEYRPDLLSIGAVYGHNGQFVAEGMRRNIPLVSDKPIAATWEQLETIRTLAAEDPRRTVLTEFNFRSQAEWLAAAKAVSDGMVGDVALAVVQKSYRFNTRPAWYGNRADYGGTILWVASHGIDAVRFVTGKSFKRLSGSGGNVCRKELPEMEDHTVTLIELSGGGSAVVHADFLNPARSACHGDDRLRLVGSRGAVSIRNGRCVLITNEEPERDITGIVKPRILANDLLAALRGEDTRMYSTAESLTSAELLLLARDAADRGQWVDVPGGRG